MRSALRNAPFAQPELDVLRDREPGKQRIFLEHDAAVRPRRPDRLAVEPQVAARRLLEAGDDVEQGGLSATARAEDGEELVVGDVEIDAVERDDFLLPRDIGEPLAQRAHDDARLLALRLGRGEVHRPWLQRSTQRPMSRMARSLRNPSTPTLSMAAMITSMRRK